MRLCLVDDAAVADLEPLTLTRPAFEIRLGCYSMGDRIARAFGLGGGAASRGAWVRPWQVDVQRERAPGLLVNDGGWLASGPVIVANSRWVPPTGFVPPDFGAPWVGLCEGEPACAWVGPGQARGLELIGVEGWFEELTNDARILEVEVGGQWIRRPWDLVAANGRRIADDLDASADQLSRRDPSSFTIVGPADRLFVDESARVDPFVVFDTTAGPIRVEAGVVVQPFTRIEGPCFIGRDTQLFRANLRGGVSLGPNCRIGGEVEESIVHGHSNKYHEGFLGHAYVGEWVNLGAITSNSDLRNDYGEVFVPLQGDPVATGQAKVGCFLGDHTRTGMGSMINTGTSVGVMCNLLPAGPLLPKHVPSFSAVLYGRVAAGFPIEQMFATARTVMGRRGQTFTATQEHLYLNLYEQTRLERERTFQKHQERHADRWKIAATSP